ncbi:MAG: hypothetical protein Q7R22_012515 [Verrucomicrobiota bacterium JB025]|nr:hypothetical protein [Verrucomicrobiota bacterium JB025]
MDAVRSANLRAHDRVNNQRAGNRELKTVRATIAATDLEDFEDGVGWLQRLGRWGLAIAMLPLCWVTMWTLLSRFFHATVEQGFWQSSEFWFFGIGAFWMVAMFWSGLAEKLFLLVYVFGHEMTHLMFVKVFWGKVTDMHVSVQGGYITTNKTNLVIALSPYVVPLWSLVAAMIYVACRFFLEPVVWLDLAFYCVTGVTWTFHIIWTIWMVPRDQPDLKENGTFLSLVIIYMANLLVLVGLLCLAEDAPLQNAREFAHEWLRHAATWGDFAWRWGLRLYGEIRAAARL